MKLRFFAAAAILFALGGVVDGQQPGAQAVRSPEVSADRRVTFRISRAESRRRAS